jgi:uncharacterized protein (DUF2236 family)
MATLTDSVRTALADAIRGRVVGQNGHERAEELFNTPGPRWFALDRPIRVVHGDTAMFIGGLRAILLQSLHPIAMAGVAQHSDYRKDPWGRLQRTADFMAATTFGTAEHAERSCAMVRRVHEHVKGTTRDGRPYRATDPHLLGWVHVVEVDSFLTSHERYGETALLAHERDGYVEDMARVAEGVGVIDPPRTVAELRASLRSYQRELASTKEAREAARFLMVPPLPVAARPAYAVISAAAISLLPWWARLSLGLPFTPVADRLAVGPASDALIQTMRWALAPNSPTRSERIEAATKVAAAG